MKVMLRVLVAATVFGLVGIAQGKEGANTGLRGKIVSVMGNGKITIQTRSTTGTGGTQPMTILTDATTTVEIDGQPGKVTDLQAGERVVIQGDPTGVVTDIKATKGKGGRRAR